MVEEIISRETEIIEKQETLDKKDSFNEITGNIVISTTISRHFHDLAKKNKIKWSEALRVGMAIILAERGVEDYDTGLNIYRKMRFFQQKVEDYGNRIAELEEKQEKLKENIK